MQPEVLKGMGEFQYQVNPAWYDHIELAGAFLVGCFIVGTIIRVLIERYFGVKECKDCPDIKRKQENLRDVILPTLVDNISTIKGDIKVMMATLNLIMEGKKLVSEEDDRNPLRGRIE